jgi:hypothetical protein
MCYVAVKHKSRQHQDFFLFVNVCVSYFSKFFVHCFLKWNFKITRIDEKYLSNEKGSMRRAKTKKVKSKI